MSSLLDNDDERMLRESARSFLAESQPISALRANRDAGRSFHPGFWRELCSMGWTGVLVPEEHGGSGMGHRAAGILAEEMGRVLAASPFLSSAVMAATALAGQAGRLAGILSGEEIYAIAVDEGPKHAPEASGLAATRQGNGFRLNGGKCFVADGGAATRLLVLARTAPDGLTLFDVEAGRAGVTRQSGSTVDSRDHARIAFRDVEATGADIVGELDGGVAALAPALRAGQAALAGELTGVAFGAFGLTHGYLRERRQFDRPIGSFQALQHRAAHLWSEIEVTASAVAHAGRMLDEAPDASELAVSLAKARSIATARLAVSEGVQMHGGIGMTDEYDIGFFMKRARVAGEWLGDYGYHAARVARARGF